MKQLFGMCLLAASLHAGAQAPDDAGAQREALIRTVGEKAPAFADARGALPPVDAARDAARVEDSLAKIRETAAKDLPEAYWTRLRALQAKYVAAMNRIDRDTFEQHQRNLAAKLAPASTEELTEMATAPRMEETAPFRKYLGDFKTLMGAYFTTRGEIARALADSYTAERQAIDAAFSAK